MPLLTVDVHSSGFATATAIDAKAKFIHQVPSTALHQLLNDKVPDTTVAQQFDTADSPLVQQLEKGDLEVLEIMSLAGSAL